MRARLSGAHLCGVYLHFPTRKAAEASEELENREGEGQAMSLELSPGSRCCRWVLSLNFSPPGPRVLTPCPQPPEPWFLVWAGLSGHQDRSLWAGLSLPGPRAVQGRSSSPVAC